MGSLIWQRLEGWALATHPGGLCAPRVRSEGNRNTAEPCTRSRAPGGAARAVSSARPLQDPASCPAAPPARFPEPRSAVTRALRGHRPECVVGAARQALSPLPLSRISQRVPDGLGRLSLRPPALAIPSVGCSPRPAHGLPVVSAPPQNRGARSAGLRCAALPALTRRPRARSWGHSVVFLRIWARYPGPRRLQSPCGRAPCYVCRRGSPD